MGLLYLQFLTTHISQNWSLACLPRFTALRTHSPPHLIHLGLRWMILKNDRNAKSPKLPAGKSWANVTSLVYIVVTFESILSMSWSVKKFKINILVPTAPFCFVGWVRAVVSFIVAFFPTCGDDILDVEGSSCDDGLCCGGSWSSSWKVCIGCTGCSAAGWTTFIMLTKIGCDDGKIGCDVVKIGCDGSTHCDDDTLLRSMTATSIVKKETDMIENNDKMVT